MVSGQVPLTQKMKSIIRHSSFVIKGSPIQMWFEALFGFTKAATSYSLHQWNNTYATSY